MESRSSLNTVRQIRSFVSPDDDTSLSTLDAATIEQIGTTVLQRSDGSFVASAAQVAGLAAAAGLTRYPSIARDLLQEIQGVSRALPYYYTVCKFSCLCPLAHK